jgi:TBC1 domain family member 20
MGTEREAGEEARQSSLASASNPGDHDSDDPSDFALKKTLDILDACKWRDLNRLRSLAEASGGFLTDDLRRIAC